MVTAGRVLQAPLLELAFIGVVAEAVGVKAKPLAPHTTKLSVVTVLMELVQDRGDTAGIPITVPADRVGIVRVVFETQVTIQAVVLVGIRLAKLRWALAALALLS